MNIMDLDFVECDSCRAKPGSPTLCNGCLNNRTAINLMNRRERAMIKAWEEDRKGVVASDQEILDARKEALQEAKRAVILALMDGKSVVLALNKLIGDSK
jgi:hypothetical protein